MCISLTEKDIDPLFKVVVVFQHVVFPLYCRHIWVA